MPKLLKEPGALDQGDGEREEHPRAEPFSNVLATPLGGPGEDSGIEQPISHIVGGEDDDVAFGVSKAEHTFVIVRPGKDGDREVMEPARHTQLQSLPPPRAPCLYPSRD